MRDACLLLFSKPARPGRVKTRLIADPADGQGGLSAEQAAALHQAFLEDLTARLETGRFDLMLAWALAAGEEPPATGRPSLRQVGADLGERLFAGLSEAAERYRLVGAVGSDHPELPLERVERGFSLLREGVDVVLGPAVDGGYYFIGARSESLHRELFSGIEWSTPEVLAQTVERCRRLSASCMLLAEGNDVDTIEDLGRLKRRLADAGDTLGAECPRTSRLLLEWSSA